MLSTFRLTSKGLNFFSISRLLFEDWPEHMGCIRLIITHKNVNSCPIYCTIQFLITVTNRGSIRSPRFFIVIIIIILIVIVILFSFSFLFDSSRSSFENNIENHSLLFYPLFYSAPKSHWHNLICT